MNPLVTVITPAYNCGQYLEQTIKSVSAQDYPEVDHIVIDDASTDNTQQVLQSCNVAGIRHVANQGEQSTVNQGLRLVEGKYFIILNGDDYLLPGAITKLVDFMEAHPDILCAYPNWDMVDEAGNLKMHMTPRDYDFAYLVSHHTWMMSVGSIFRSEVIKKVGLRDESLKYLGDADYWLRIGLVGKMARVPETLACWRYHNGQASSQRNSQRAAEHVRVMEKLFHYTYPYQCTQSFKTEAMCWANLVASTITGTKKETISYIINALDYYPQILVKPEFWDTVLKRASYFIRRRA